MKTIKQLLAERAAQRKKLQETKETLENNDREKLEKEIEDNKALLDKAEERIKEMEKDATTNVETETEISNEKAAEIAADVKGLLND